MIGRIRNSIRYLIGNRLVQHILFWALSFLILVNIQKVSSEIKTIDLIYTVLFHIPILLVVYLNFFFLFPRFLERGRYFIYGLLIIVIIAAGSLFYLIFFNRWIDFILPGYYFIAYYNFRDISLYLLIYTLATSLIRLAKGWFRLQDMEREKTLTELWALKSQINPHFLFNSLNSIYGLARKSSALVPDSIIQLSEILRYVIYDSDVEFISLEKELKVIEQYIKLQNLRSDESSQIFMEIKGDVGGYKIAPLIFLPFIENSFKHGLKGGNEKSFVNIMVEVGADRLIFLIINSKGKSSEPEKEYSSGIGINNVRKRLDLLYPGRHLLKITKNEDTFEVFLELKLNN